MRVEATGRRRGSVVRGRFLAVAAGVATVLAAMLASPGTADAAPAAVSPSAQVLGTDVSASQGTVDWAAAWQNGARFAYVKATESTSYLNPDFAAQFLGSSQAGLLHGAYHFAVPDASSGQAQADFFVAHGGGWSKDGQTLPPLLDIENNPYGSACYGKSQAAMATWIRNFVDEVHAKTTRWPVIYTSTAWWTSCTGNDASFGADDPLFIGDHATNVGALPAGWSTYTFWQYAASGVLPGGQDKFNGTLDQLKALAVG